MSICMITSVPLVPPWDQADKNLAYMLSQAIPEEQFHVLTVKDEPPPPGSNLQPLPFYTSRRPSMAQKMAIYGQLLLGALPGSGGARADLYHFIYRPYPLSSRLCRVLPEFRRKPTLHTLPASAGGDPLRRDLFFADCVVVLSDYARQLLSRLGVPHVEHIPPGIEIGPWVALRERGEALKERLGLAGRPVVLFPGHYGPGYGADVVLRALPLLVEQVPDAALIFACRPRTPGDDEREQEARRMIADLGLERSIRFFSLVEDMTALVGASDCVMLPIETMRDKMDLPTTLLEALAAGKPFVISDIPPMNELLADEVGYSVPPGDHQALAEKVGALLSDLALRERMARRGYELVSQRYDIRQVAHEYRRLYRELLGSQALERG